MSHCAPEATIKQKRFQFTNEGSSKLQHLDEFYTTIYQILQTSP